MRCGNPSSNISCTHGHGANRLSSAMQTMLGVTVLAGVNSDSDLVDDVSMARDGFPTTGVAAFFASPLFSSAAAVLWSSTIGRVSVWVQVHHLEDIQMMRPAACLGHCAA
jgi:Ca2+/Na+ antiporter